jgi:hypothetical protein
VPPSLLEEALTEYQVVFSGVERLLLIKLGLIPVGFYSPRETPMGTRIGPLFISPSFRRRGIALSIYRSIEGPLVACVRDDNPASVALHERADFVQWRRYAAGWWWRRP